MFLQKHVYKNYCNHIYIKLPVCVSADISFHRFILLFGEFKGD